MGDRFPLGAALHIGEEKFLASARVANGVARVAASGAHAGGANFPVALPANDEVRHVIGIFSKIKVECYSGYRGDEEPRRFQWIARTLEVTEILDRWLDPNHRYFKVRADDDATYILRHDTNSGEWEMSRRVSR